VGSRLRVDLDALTANYLAFRAAGGQRQVGAVVKADAYGLGAARVAATLSTAGCRHFFVATAAEGERLRDSLPHEQIFVFEGATADNVDTLLARELVPVVNDALQLARWQPHRNRPIAVQVDTGMSRLGFDRDLAPERLAGFDVCLLMSHFACADEPDHPHNRTQLERLKALAARFPGIPTSFGNSAAALGGALTESDVERPGIGLYGGNPFSDREHPLNTVARFEGSVLQLRTVAPGEGVGYGMTAVADRPLRLAIVGMGYADGVPRLLSNRGSMAWQGSMCPIVGRVSMDLTAVDVSGCGVQPVPGDWLECFGDTVSVDQVAAWAETISYEVLTGIRPRVPRVYQQGAG